MCAVRKSCVFEPVVFTSRTRSAPRLLGVPEYAMVVFAAPQLREYEELRNDPSSFEGRARTDEAAVKTRHPGDCVATRAGGSKEWDWTRSAPAPPSSIFRGCAASWIDGRHLRIVSSQGLGRGAQSRRVGVVGARAPAARGGHREGHITSSARDARRRSQVAPRSSCTIAFSRTMLLSRRIVATGCPALAPQRFRPSDAARAPSMKPVA